MWKKKIMKSLGAKRVRNCHRWTELPDDVIISILSRLTTFDILTSVPMVCKAWFNICKNPLMWLTIDMRGLLVKSNREIHLLSMKYDLKKMCRHAVDSSCGNLVKVKFDDFNDAATVLEYIADSSSRIRSLRLVNSAVELGKVASKLPLLEHLEISLYHGLSRESLQVVGRSCPLLKSFKLNKTWYGGEIGCNDDALAIAGTMHGLQHLQIIGNLLTDGGLRKILDCCPRLVSLDLRCCFNLDLDGDLRKRCAEGIRTLWLPEDSIADYEFSESAIDNYLYPDSGRWYRRFIPTQGIMITITIMIMISYM
ncbi:hypothetical protein ACFX13_001647 [Malus domestica]